MSLRTISNHHQDVQVWDIDPSQDRGPFVITQEGCAPGDETARAKVFVMRKDGTWADVAYYLAGKGRNKLSEIMFNTTAEVMDLLYRLDPKPRVAKLEVSEEEILEWHRANPRVQPGLEGLRQWAVEFRRQTRERVR